MPITLAKKSGILLLKSKFFLSRALIYSTFLFLPIWLPKELRLPLILQYFFMITYLLFMAGQWFMLGKEVDHRFKIFFKVNSSLDRIIYRTLLGMTLLVVFFNIIHFLPQKWASNCFFITWGCLGLFYSWPTRGKIIRESVTSNFGEFKHLDAFERLLLLLIIFFLFASSPLMPEFFTVDALQLFFDPQEKISQQLWNFLYVTYIPFATYPELKRVALSSFFYIGALGGFLTIFYAFLRFYVTRRLAMLGVFSLISSWSFSKILAVDYGTTLFSTYTLLWFWSSLWVYRSSSYRVGLFWGMLGYWSVLINTNFIYLYLFQVALMLFLYQEKTKWFKKKLFRYASLGLVLTLLTLVIGSRNFSLHPLSISDSINQISMLFNRKALYVLSIPGLIAALLFALRKEKLAIFKQLTFDKLSLKILIFSVSLCWIFSLTLDSDFMSNYSIMWPLVLFALIPIEVIFQLLNRSRSRRNFIYLAYIVTCLLDSHLEGRIKIFIKAFGID